MPIVHETQFHEGIMQVYREVPGLGIELHFELRGTGEPLLLLHGFGGCSQDFQYVARPRFEERYRLIVPDARGHGRSSNDQALIRHDQCARDSLALLDELGVERVKAIGVSMGGNTLLHMACMEPDRIDAMVLVSATARFPEQARAIMRLLPEQPTSEDWQRLRAVHQRGDAQIEALWRAQRAFAASDDDLCFTPHQLGNIRARTLVYYGDQDPLYPIGMAEELANSIPGARLALVSGGHSPVFLEQSEAFATRALEFLAA